MLASEILVKLHQAKLYAILDTGYSDPTLWPSLLPALIQGGVHIVQLRAKTNRTADIERWAEQIQPILKKAGIPFIINDHPLIAKEIHADGCHVGQDDLSVAEARDLTDGLIIGKSTHSLTQAKAAQKETADYIGFGPLFATPTKPDYQPVGIYDIAEMARCIQIPHFCIGGIKRENVAALKKAGAQRVVIVSGLLQASDPRSYAQEVVATLSNPNEELI